MEEAGIIAIGRHRIFLSARLLLKAALLVEKTLKISISPHYVSVWGRSTITFSHQAHALYREHDQPKSGTT